MLIFLLLRGGCVYAQERNSTEFSVNFHVSNMEIDPAYMSNAERIAELVSFLQRLDTDSTVNIVSITFCGAASPEGSYEFNKMLAKGRTEALEKLVRSKVSLPDSIVTYQDNYIPWEYLSSLVSTADIAHKDEILDILGQKEIIVRYYDDKRIDDRVLRLRAIDGGKTWRELHKRFFEPMRNACMIFVTYEQIGATDSLHTCRYIIRIPALLDLMHLALTDSLQTVSPGFAQTLLPDFTRTVLSGSTQLVSTDSIQYVEADSVPLDKIELWQRNLTVKTNLLGLCLAIANGGVEIDLCKQVSFHLPVYYSAWNYFTPTVKFRTFALYPEVRYWFNDKKLCNDGWFAGAHFGLAYYNVATNGAYRTQDHDGTCPALGGGLTVGYRMPISENNRWKLEFSLGAGVYGLHYDKFRNIPNGFWVTAEKRTYFGIDRAAVSLSYTFGMKRKGGAL